MIKKIMQQKDTTFCLGLQYALIDIDINSSLSSIATLNLQYHENYSCMLKNVYRVLIAMQGYECRLVN